MRLQAKNKTKQNIPENDGGRGVDSWTSLGRKLETGPLDTQETNTLEYKMGYRRIKASHLKAIPQVPSNKRNCSLIWPVILSLLLSAYDGRTFGSTCSSNELLFTKITRGKSPRVMRY